MGVGTVPRRATHVPTIDPMDAALFEGLCTVTITEVENGSLEFPLPHSFSAGAAPIWIFRQAADAMEPTVVRFRISAVCTSLGVHEVLYLVEKHAIGTNGFGRDSMGRVSGPDPKTGTFSRSVTLEHDGKGDPSRF